MGHILQNEVIDTVSFLLIPHQLPQELFISFFRIHPFLVPGNRTSRRLFGKISARLAHKRHQAELRFLMILIIFPVQHQHLRLSRNPFIHLCQREHDLIAGKSLQAVRGRIVCRLLHAGKAPVGAAVITDIPTAHLFLQSLQNLPYGPLRIIPVQKIQIDAVTAQIFQAEPHILSNSVRIHPAFRHILKRRMTAFCGDNDLRALFPGRQPAADHPLAAAPLRTSPVPIDQSRIQEIPAPFRIQVHLPERLLFRYSRSVLCRPQRQNGNLQAAGT